MLTLVIDTLWLPTRWADFQHTTLEIEASADVGQGHTRGMQKDLADLNRRGAHKGEGRHATLSYSFPPPTHSQTAR